MSDNLLQPLHLTAILDEWRLVAIRNSDEKFTSFKKRVLTRDGYRCQYCGFTTKRHQVIVNRDGNYRNNKLTNLCTACCFCAQALFYDMAGKYPHSGGTLIYMPELPQADLNALCHVLFAAIYSNVNIAVEAQAVYQTLKTRAKVIEKCFGTGMSDPVMFGKILLNASADNRRWFEKRIAQNFRLLPLYHCYEDILGDWLTELEDSIVVTEG